MTVRRTHKGIGRYLTQSKVLLLNDESDRHAAIAAVEDAGFEVRHPIGAYPLSEPMFNGNVKAIGAWGNVIGLEVGANVFVALVDLDSGELFCISDELKPAPNARLALLGVTVDVSHPPTFTYKRLDECTNGHEMLNSRLTWRLAHLCNRLLARSANKGSPCQLPREATRGGHRQGRRGRRLGLRNI